MSCIIMNPAQQKVLQSQLHSLYSLSCPCFASTTTLIGEVSSSLPYAAEWDVNKVHDDKVTPQHAELGKRVGVVLGLPTGRVRGYLHTP
jgi:hypothetical protein